MDTIDSLIDQINPKADSTGRPILLTDSRSLLKPEQTLFFALKTPSGDGHKFVKELYDKGVRQFVVEHRPEGDFPGAHFFEVASPLEALQTIAKAWRDKHDLHVVGITGSRGKTSVKEWAHHVLRHKFITSRSPRSYNSQIGVPLSLWQIEPDTQLALIEAGISQPGEMERLEKIVSPDICIFTNIGGPHSSGFSSIEEKCHEKAQLLKNCGTAIYSADNELIASCVPDVPVKIGWSRTDPKAMIYIYNVSRQGKSTTFEYSFQQGVRSGKITIPFTSEQDLENAIHVLSLALIMGVSDSDLQQYMTTLPKVATRLEVLEGVNGCQIIHDSFTADLPSLIQAVDFMDRRVTPSHSKTLILGDLITDEGTAADTYAAAAALCRQRNVGRVITVGPEIKKYAHLFGDGTLSFDTVDDLLANMSEADFHDELILIKGDNALQFHRVGEMLEASQHETVMEINLDAVVDNFNFYKSRIKPTTGIVCMIKASGYGAGAHELAKTLQSQGAAYLAVAVHDEGAHLRREGITMPIIVLNPMVDNFKTLFDNRLEPEIYSLDFLKRLITEAKRLGIREYPVHIKIDSGMHRLGFRLETLPGVIEVLKGQDYVVPRSIFSHLCAADDPTDDDYTMGQFDYFGQCCHMLLSAFPERKILRHILNSTGITRFPDYQFDMVRLGIGLYGVRTMHDGSQDALRPVSTLRTAIISLKTWPAGTSIGYNRRGRLRRESVIATIPIGYADGLNRHFGNGGTSMRVGGVLCPTVGNICMDACMIDVTDVPDVAVGQSVEVFGDTISVDTLADTLGTIPYEVLTSISERVKRVYYRE